MNGAENPGLAGGGAAAVTDRTLPSRLPVGNGAVPAMHDRFVGRESELADLTSRLADVRLVSLVGPAGSGKTRLAIELARRVGSRFRDGVRFVELGTADRSQLVAPLFATALGIAEWSTEQPAESLATTLTTRDMLLVVDNCEHLLDSCAALIEALLHRCPALRVLTTSREGLRICGEVVVPVAGLALPASGGDGDPQAAPPWQCEAVQLFVERARERCPDLTFDEDSGPAVAAVCTRLDGLPLAIELATRQLDLLGLRGLLAALDDRFETLVVGSRTAADRHTSLRAAIDWSYDLLSPREQTVFRRLSVLPGCFDLDGAIAVSADEQLSAAEVATALGGLIDRSLVVRLSQPEAGQAPRFRQLESIRMYGSDRLAEAGDLAQCWLRVVDWLARRAEEVAFSAQGADAADRVGPDCDSLHRAVEWAIDHGDDRQAILAIALGNCWWAQGFTAEREQLLTAVLERPSTPPAHRSAVQRALAQHAINRGDYRRAEELATASVEVERSLGRPDTLASSLSMFGYCRRLLGDLEAAVEYLRDALRTAQAADPPQDTDAHQQRLLEALLDAGRLTEASAVLAELLAALRERGPSPMLAATLHSAGRLALLNEDLDMAWHRFAEALGQDRADQDRADQDPVGQDLVGRQPDGSTGLADSLEGLAIVAVLRDRPARGLRLAAAAAGLRERLKVAAEPAWQRRVDAALDQARAALGARRAAAAEAAGRHLTAAAAVAAALDPPTAGSPSSTAEDPLTQRETEVAGLVTQGLANREIATRLGVSRRTVEAHLEHIRKKLRVTSRVQVALWFTQQYGVPPQPSIPPQHRDSPDDTGVHSEP